MHVGYETVDPYPLDDVTTARQGTSAADVYRVDKMRHPGRGDSLDRSTLIYNAHVTRRGIPDEVHDYHLGQRSALAC